MVITSAGETLAKQRCDAFERLQRAFETSFRFVQDVYGQRRFATFPVKETVRSLHALWICECKDRLLLPMCVLLDNFAWQAMHTHEEHWYLVERILVAVLRVFILRP